MKSCSVCGRDFEPGKPPQTPAEEAGLLMAREMWGDAGDLCPSCLASRGTLGMMYCQECFD